MNAVSGWTIIVESRNTPRNLRSFWPPPATSSPLNRQVGSLARRAFAISRRMNGVGWRYRARVGTFRYSGTRYPCTLPAIDWVAENRLFSSFTGEILLRPTHYDELCPQGASLAVDAGPAGTGSHGSCLAASCAGRTIAGDPGSFLDLGCGGYSRCYRKTLARKVAADIDPDAVATCRRMRVSINSLLVRVVESNGFGRGRVAQRSTIRIDHRGYLGAAADRNDADIRRKIRPGGGKPSGFTENQENDMRVP